MIVRVNLEAIWLVLVEMYEPAQTKYSFCYNIRKHSGMSPLTNRKRSLVV